MLKIHKEGIKVTLNRLVKEGKEGNLDPVLTPEMVETIEEVIEEIIGNKAVIEVMVLNGDQ
jgi:hypothetical protein